MITYLKTHEAYITQLIETNPKDTDWNYITKLHGKKIKYFQHERLIHLLVMLTTSLASLISFFFTLLLNKPEYFILAFVLLILSLGYVIHYFKLENGVQRLYRLGDRLEQKNAERLV